MRILMISTWLPYPPDTGFRIRAFNLLRKLSVRHQITLVSFGGHESEPSHVAVLEQFCQRVLVVPHDPFAPRPVRSVLGLLAPYPRFLSAGCSRQMERVVDEAFSTGQFDLVLNLVIVAAHHARHVTGVPQVLDLLEVTQLVQEVDGQRLLSRMKRQLANRKLASYVRQMLERGIVCTTASDAEKSAILRLVGSCRATSIEVVPNGVDYAAYVGTVPNRELAPYLVFNGAMTFNANLEAMTYFLSQVWPRIHSQMPKLSMKITGSHAGVRLDSLRLAPEISLTGYVDDVRPLVAGAAACVVPILTGGGTRVKILEAMALGVPVIASPKAVEGLDVRHEEHVLIADAPERFAAEVIRVLNDGSLRANVVAEARRLVRDRYDWDRIGCAYEEIIQRVVRNA